jgi:hypothetical protein
VVDAGYYDNYGVGVAASWLFSGRNTPRVDEWASKIVLVQIRDAAGDHERCLRVVPPQPSGFGAVLGRSLEELSTPPEGLYNAVFAAALFRNDGQLELLSSYSRANQLRVAAITLIGR